LAGGVQYGGDAVCGRYAASDNRIDCDGGDIFAVAAVDLCDCFLDDGFYFIVRVAAGGGADGCGTDRDSVQRAGGAAAEGVKGFLLRDGHQLCRDGDGAGGGDADRRGVSALARMASGGAVQFYHEHYARDRDFPGRERDGARSGGDHDQQCHKYSSHNHLYGAVFDHRRVAVGHFDRRDAVLDCDNRDRGVCRCHYPRCRRAGSAVGPGDGDIRAG